MNKIGIVSCYFKHNYGSVLQAYATQKVLDDLGIENETINIDGNIDFSKGKRKFYLREIFNIGFIKTKFGMIKLRIDKFLNKDLKTNITIRNKKYEEFKKNFHLTDKFKTYKQLNEKCQDYSCVVVGSDQLWLPVNIVADYYTLNWVPENVNKVSYSTSFGISEIPKKYEKKYELFLKRINNLSVREISGKNIIKKLCLKDAEIVCDPTILLSADEWSKNIGNKRIIKEKYILCYFLGKNINHRKFAERLKQKTGCKIVSINHADEYVRYSDIYADIIPYDIGPFEWINLIKNADYVCTDSFHGTIFSIIFNKKFYSFRRYNKENSFSTNSRIDSLFENAGINKKRILEGTENIDEVLNYELDYSQINNNIEIFRDKSKKWLLNAISK